MTVEEVPPLVLGIDTSTVVNVGLRVGDEVLATADGGRCPGPRRGTHPAGEGVHQAKRSSVA